MSQAPTIDAAAMPELDICVIGAGAAGLAVASAAALFGVPVGLVERGPMGPERPAGGGVALQALYAAARRVRAVAEAGAFGVVGVEPRVDFSAVMNHVARSSAAAAINDSRERMVALGIRVIDGDARFVSRRTITAGGQTIKARRFVVATGSEPARPALDGLDQVQALDVDDLFALRKLPERLVILGGSPEAAGIAQAMARLGSVVTLVEPGGLLPDEEPEAVALIRRALLRDRVELHENAAPRAVRPIRRGIAVEIEGLEGAIEGSHILIAAGRAPTIAGLDLDLAGIRTRSGAIEVDGAMRTSNRRVLAVGSVTGSGGPFAAHVAAHHAGVALKGALFRLPARVSLRAVPQVAGCDPEIARVGLTEAQARGQRGGVQLLRWPFSENERARAERATAGLVKIVLDSGGKVVGATVAGDGASELIAPWVMAVKDRLAIRDMADYVFPHPTLSEASKRAATSFYQPLASRAGVRRMIGMLRRLG